MTDLKDKIFPVVPENCFPGVTSVFHHLRGAGLCNWNFEMDARYLRDGLPGYGAHDGDVVIFGAWHEAYRPALRRMGPETGVRKFVLWTSAPYQTEAAEVEARILEEQLVPLAQRGAVDGILFGSRHMANAYDRVIPGRAHWFPYPVSVSKFYEPGENAPRLGMFYPAHHRKNLYAQCLAVRRAAPFLPQDWKLVSNFPPPVRIESEHLDTRSWMPRSTYDAVLHEIRLNLHVTVTESFGYQVVDALAMGAPSLVSECVFQNLFGSDSTQEKTWSNSYETGRVVDFEDVAALSDMIARLLPFREQCHALWHTQVDALRAKAEDHRRRLEILLKTLVE